jgi:tRNA 5-methylaminomethyl-2-thiouridine biosynthesis bifunctional protein
MLPSLDTRDMPVLAARTALRCTTGDQLPVIGPVPDWQATEKRYAQLSRSAHARIHADPCYLPGLFINTAHGSYGLATCPLAADYLAALIDNAALPLTRPLSDTVHPARFIIRRLKQQRQKQKGGG